jgi:hypothetical protein
VIRRLQGLPDKTVVVDLAIDGEDNALIGIGEWLSSALYPFVSRGVVGFEIDGR